MGVEGLAVLLDVVGVSRPEAGNLKIAPTVGGHGVGGLLARLPAPQAVEADALTGGGFLSVGFAQVPDGLDAGGKRDPRRPLGAVQAAEDHSSGAEKLAAVQCAATTFRGHGDLLQ